MTRLADLADETGFQRTVTDLAHLCGWRSMHVRPVTDHRGRTRTPTTCAGWPDVVMFHPAAHRFLIVELKSQSGHLSAEQRDVIEALRESGVDVRVWRPSDWPEIETTLRTGAVP